MDRQRVFLLSWGDLGVETVSHRLISICVLKASSDGSVILKSLTITLWSADNTTDLQLDLTKLIIIKSSFSHSLSGM